MSEHAQSHEELLVWRKAVDLSVMIYKITEQFPKQELYGLTSQVRRAAVSVPSNIAEGRHRSTKADFMNFLYIARGSLAELETQILIAKRLSFLDEETYSRTKNLAVEVSKMLHGMIKGLR